MSENTKRARAVQERMAQRSGADRPVTKFGRTGRRAPFVRAGAVPDESRAAAEAAWRRYGEAGPSRFDRDPARDPTL